MGLDASERRHLGHAVEAWVARQLEARGWRILERNFTVRGGEIDLVAEREGVRAYVEVRSRSRGDRGPAEATIDRRKIQRIVLAARHHLARHGDGGCDLRFDVVAVVLEDGRPRQLEHLEDAFRP
ncbi:MAG: YraN family protein [Deltaproteobacteria bacterium]|nr:YraN family protein [Deltaproteobacteria bacterium]